MNLISTLNSVEHEQININIIIGITPWNCLENTIHIYDYLLMFILPLYYIICFILLFVAHYGICSLEGCSVVCCVGSRLFSILGFVTYLICQLFTIWRQKKFYIKYQEVSNVIDAKIRSLQFKRNQNMTHSSTGLLYNASRLIVLLAFSCAITIHLKEVLFYYHGWFFIPFTVSTLPLMACSTIMAQFYDYISEINQRFENLNNLLEQANSECQEPQGVIFKCSNFLCALKRGLKNNPLKNQQLGNKRVSGSHKINKNNASKAKPFLRTTKDSGQHITEFFKLYDNLLSLCVMTNAEYNLQCVSYMVTCFVLTLFAIFLLAKVHLLVGGMDRLLDFTIFWYCTWSGISLFMAYIVLRVCYYANSYMKQLPAIAHRIIRKRPAFLLTNDMNSIKITSYTLQFIHWRGYFQFNGVGLFILDYTFIFLMVSAATSYLIVLVQFDTQLLFIHEGLL